MSSAYCVTAEQLEAFRDDFEALRLEMGKIVVGHEDAIDGLLIAAIAGGHTLLEGVPGVGKTLLVRTLGEVLEILFQRIQFTPDLMPADIIGTYVVMETPQGRRMFEFQQGPLFSNLILADQINRGTPKTQSALLEAMEGQTVSVSSEKFDLPQPFVVMATQNPLDMEGTFPLPEPEIDRFFFKLTINPPGPQQMEEILTRTTEGERAPVRSVVNGQRLLAMRAIARGVALPDALRRWAVGLVASTHPDHPQASASVRQFVRYGSSPRGAQALVVGAKVRAAAAGRSEVGQEDLRAVAHAALRHRVFLNFEGQAENVRPDSLIDSLLGEAQA
jgi:MoxR-like ATPase